MVDSTGRVKGDKLWHVYRYPQQPKTLMVLGSILTRPDRLESSLNHRQVMVRPFPEGKTIDQTQAARSFVRSEFSKKTGGRLKALLPCSPVASAGGGLAMDVSSSVESTIEASRVRAVAMMPDVAGEFVDEALQLPRVVEHLRKGFFAEPLYMIVGVATCKKLFLGSTSSRGGSGSLDLDASVSVAGVEAGVGASRDRKASTEFAVEIDDECDFAYRVREFQYSRRKKRIKKSVDVTEGAMFGNDADDGSGSGVAQYVEEEEVPVFEHFESEDEDLS